MQFARNVHRGQQRKYTGNPHADHLAEVAGIVATVAAESVKWDVVGGVEGRVDRMVATAWLHDCIEDQGITRDQLAIMFGPIVADGVLLLSDMDEGSRAWRKAAARDRLAAAPGWIQTIKCADLISNTSSIVMHDPKFAVTYLEEKHLLLDVLVHADPRLHAMARQQAGAA